MSMQPCLSRAEADLLAAAFLDDPQAITAWQRWSAGVDWDGYLDHTSFALLPRAYRNLRRLGVEDPIFPRCNGIMRQAWLANQHLIKGFGSALDTLGQAGVVPLLLPPTWVLSRDRSAVLDRGHPIRWAIAPAQAEPAIRALLALGWGIDRVLLPRWSLAGYIAGTHELVLRPPQGPRWLLTWRLDLWLDEQAARAAAEPCDFGSRKVLALAPHDALGFVLCHPRWTGAFGLAAVLLTIASVGAVRDWPEVTSASAGVLPPDWNSCMDRLQHLFAQWGAPTAFGRLTTNVPAVLPAPRRNPLHRLVSDWLGYRAALGERSSMAEPLRQLPGYLMGRWRLRHPRQLPRRALQWLLPAWKG